MFKGHCWFIYSYQGKYSHNGTSSIHLRNDLGASRMLDITCARENKCSRRGLDSRP